MRHVGFYFDLFIFVDNNFEENEDLKIICGINFCVKIVLFILKFVLSILNFEYLYHSKKNKFISA